MTRKKVRTLPAARADAVKQIAPANPSGTKENPPEVERRKPVMMRVMQGMKRKPVSRSFRRPWTPYALTEVHLRTLVTASSNGGHVKSMPWN